MASTLIEGIQAKHVEITAQCRKNRGKIGAFEKAMRHIRREYDDLEGTEANQGATFHVVLTVDRDAQ